MISLLPPPIGKSNGRKRRTKKLSAKWDFNWTLSSFHGNDFLSNLLNAKLSFPKMKRKNLSWIIKSFYSFAVPAFFKVSPLYLRNSLHFFFLSLLGSFSNIVCRFQKFYFLKFEENQLNKSFKKIPSEMFEKCCALRNFPSLFSCWRFIFVLLWDHHE